MNITLRRIIRSFGAGPVLHGIDLDVASGELVALLGPSGSGKTTLLRIIAGLDLPDSGEIYFGSDNASDKPVQERQVGFVFQNYALFSHLNVIDNIAFGLHVRDRARRPGAAEIRKRALDLLDLVQLSGFENRFPAQLSGGQRQRVALARALAVEPRVLLLDEPFGALDTKVRKELRGWVRDIHRRTGHTTLFVTHDQDEALELADRVVILNEGRIVQEGSPDAIYDAPVSPFVASFIGESNQMAVDVRNGCCFLGPLALVPAAGVPDGPALLVFRPHDVALMEDGTGIAGEVLAQRTIGALCRLEVALPAVGHRIQIDLPRHARATTGAAVSLSIARSRLFVASTGLAT
jgi:sulfate transport system ATP-binding protein